MKKYIKPISAIEDLKVDDAFMLTGSPDNIIGENEDDNTTSGNNITEGDAKERNAWNEGLW
jgi:hypothetical protein